MVPYSAKLMLFTRVASRIKNKGLPIDDPSLSSIFERKVSIS
jgi:hypothetical protein